jgi:hypothetical protein
MSQNSLCCTCEGGMTCAVCFNQVADAHGLSFNEYQRQAFTTAVYPGKGSNIIYTILGLCGGETCKFCSEGPKEAVAGCSMSDCTPVSCGHR